MRHLTGSISPAQRLSYSITEYSSLTITPGAAADDVDAFQGFATRSKICGQPGSDVWNAAGAAAVWGVWVPQGRRECPPAGLRLGRQSESSLMIPPGELNDAGSVRLCR